MAKILGWKEFVVSFLIISFATSLPNLFVGISSITHQIPELSFSDIVGGNLIDLTLGIGLSTLVAKGISTQSRLIQASTIFTSFVAILPLLLIFDGILGGGDGVILIWTFLFYAFWLFSKKERFAKVYEEESPLSQQLKNLFESVWKIFIGTLLLLLSAEGIVNSASFFINSLKISLPMMGILVVALGTSLPEIYFSLFSARKKEGWLILGNMMGSVIFNSTLVLGIISLLSPIRISNFSPFFIARIFLFLASLFFFFFIKTERKLTEKEGLFLIFLYLLFIFLELKAPFFSPWD